MTEENTLWKGLFRMADSLGSWRHSNPHVLSTAHRDIQRRPRLACSTSCPVSGFCQTCISGNYTESSWMRRIYFPVSRRTNNNWRTSATMGHDSVCIRKTHKSFRRDFIRMFNFQKILQPQTKKNMVFLIFPFDDTICIFGGKLHWKLPFFILEKVEAYGFKKLYITI